MKFKTSDSRLRHRNGQKIKILKTFSKADKNHDKEVLPMFLIEFEDGFKEEAFKDELIK